MDLMVTTPSLPLLLPTLRPSKFMEPLRISIDASGYQRAIALLASRIHGDSEVFIANESGHLAMEIGRRLGPSDLPSAKKKRDKDVAGHLTIAQPANISPRSNIPAFLWLNAGPNFLTGIDDVDNLPTADGIFVMQEFRRSQDKGNRGNVYIKMGKRGKQTIQRLNRIRVAKTAYNFVRKQIADRYGILKASFAFTAQVLGIGGRIPGWVTKHYEDKAAGRAVLDLSRANSISKPSITFGSTSPGVESNPRVVQTIQSSIETRRRIVNAKFNKVVNGWIFDHNSGRVYRPYKDGEWV
jgi:hypothetical protein